MSQKVVVVGAGPVGSLAALYAAVRGFEVEVYELRAGKIWLVNHLDSSEQPNASQISETLTPHH
jgi:2-polyprenyl-6-methoxyphenol hydroxylase-like FAD-dependent oxidoreductase